MNKLLFTLMSLIAIGGCEFYLDEGYDYEVYYGPTPVLVDYVFTDIGPYCQNTFDQYGSGPRSYHCRWDCGFLPGESHNIGGFEISFYETGFYECGYWDEPYSYDYHVECSYLWEVEIYQTSHNCY
tara:strand:- start:594 stop:971 length:378 start_codon:yes stop_codon:yes gene_type:complete